MTAHAGEPVFDDPHLFMFAIAGKTRDEARKALKRVVQEKGYHESQWDEIPPNEKVLYDRAFVATRDMVRGNAWSFKVDEKEPYSIDVINQMKQTIRRIIFVVRLKEAKGRHDVHS